ncbi:MAG: hypothetical protein HY670_04700 [Chloroflexi bacterium]|nr:hypothetical protein [Chloroflexota bacterium]
MATSALVRKLLIKGGQEIAFINAPPGYVSGLGEMPSGVTVAEKLEGPLDFVQVFIRNKQELAPLVPAVLRALKHDGLLWICYPKGTARVKTDLNRDILWQAMEEFGQAGVAMVSLDSVWSAMRFRPQEKVGKAA